MLQKTPLKKALKNDENEEGIALVMVVVMLFMMTILVSDLAFNATVDHISAANGRDSLRAHYLARSSVNLSHLLLRVQKNVIDPQKDKLEGAVPNIAEFAPMIIAAFNSKEGAAMLGGILGIQTDQIKGLGVDEGSEFELELEPLEGKLNVNCAGGFNAQAKGVQGVYASLKAMLSPRRFDKIFDENRENGDYIRRNDVIAAIMDWADQDTVVINGQQVEEYGYTRLDDPYESKNHYYDTLEELRMVHGVDDYFMEIFGPNLTVYGSCKVDVSTANNALLTAVIVQSAADSSDNGLEERNLTLLVKYVVHIRELFGSFPDLKGFTKAVETPMEQIKLSQLANLAAGGESDSTISYPHVTGIKLDQKKLKAIVSTEKNNRVWNIIATARVNKVERKISAVWDSDFVSSDAIRYKKGKGAYLYWKEE